MILKKPKHQQQYWANKRELTTRFCAVIAPRSADIKHLAYSMAVQLVLDTDVLQRNW